MSDKEKIYKHLEVLIQRYPELSSNKENIEKAYVLLEECYENGGKLLVAGNGGSAADSEHIVGELMKGFENERKLHANYKEALINSDKELGKTLADNLQMALPAIALDGHIALNTAYMNDCEPLLCFAQQVNGYVKMEMYFLQYQHREIVKTFFMQLQVAKAKGMKVIGLTGANDSRLSEMADIIIRSSHTRTYMIQEHHLPIYHCLCLMLEERFFGE